MPFPSLIKSLFFNLKKNLFGHYLNKSWEQMGLETGNSPFRQNGGPGCQKGGAGKALHPIGGRK